MKYNYKYIFACIIIFISVSCLLQYILLGKSCLSFSRLDPTTAEHFQNRETLPDSYNLLKNGSFQSGADISGKIMKTGKNAIVKDKSNPNCDVSQYILQQSPKSTYVVHLTLHPNFTYRLTYWSTLSKNSCFIKLNSDQLCNSTPKLNVKTALINNKTVDSVQWFKHELVFMMPATHSAAFLQIGCAQNQHPASLTDFTLLPHLQQSDNFAATIGLQTFLDAQNRQSCSDGTSLVWNDLSNNSISYKWEKKPTWSPDGYFLTKNNTLVGPSSATLLNRAQEFSFVIQSKSSKSSSAAPSKEDAITPIPVFNSALFIPGAPDNDGTAIAIDIPNEYGKIKLIINDVILETDEYVMPQNDNIYTITFKEGILKLWINKTLVQTFTGLQRPYFNEKLVKINATGKWDAQFAAFLAYDVELPEAVISYINYYLVYRPQKRQNAPIVIINPIDVIPIVNIDPKKKKQDQNQCPQAYINPKTREFMVYIPKGSKYAATMGFGVNSYGTNKERANSIYKENFPDCPIPEVLRFDRIPHDKCPFIVARGNPCSEPECRGVNWSEKNIHKTGMTDGCRTHVSHYCHINRNTDPRCFCWKEENLYNPACQKFRRDYEPPEDYGFNINVFDIEEHPDMKNYIRKDKIPCWNCNLE